MPQRIERLRSTIRELEEELQHVTEVDDATRAELRQVVNDIEEALDAEAESPPESLGERLQEAERQFQASHPTVSGIIMRMVDALGQLGI